MNRRIRPIAGALGFIAILGLLSAAPASASGESIGGCALHAAIVVEESLGSLHALENDGFLRSALEDEMEACLEAPSAIIPELDEIIWGGSAFLVLFFFMVRKGFPAVKGAMDARADKIAADLDQAEQAKNDAAQIRADHALAMAGAKTEAAGIIADARAQADQLKADLQTRAEADIAEMRSRAQADMESSRTQAISDLRAEVSEVAVGAAEAVIKANLDHRTQSALVDAYIDEVASRG